MYTKCYMSDTSMIRISSELKSKLKDKATKQGRTLEWMANEAISEYLLPSAAKTATSPYDAKPWVNTARPVDEPKYESNEDWGA